MLRMIATDKFSPVPIDQAPITIGERFRRNVRQLMSDRQLSQAALAERLTALGHPSNAESVRQLLRFQSVSVPSLKWLELMARVFDVSETALISDRS